MKCLERGKMCQISISLSVHEKGQIKNSSTAVYIQSTPRKTCLVSNTESNTVNVFAVHHIYHILRKYSFKSEL